ncbi:HAD family hydrolase [Aggregatilinea lenta]|uniref:HAD family hydrolase n=1 Tax=Aggregatilinea lenta TaxID=913108 RepID=UPI000E5B14D5|nr:HAD family phosphatase [Aggregatilinea lenta]
MIKALILDFGGVIVRTEDYAPRYAWDHRLNLPPGSAERAVHGSDAWMQAQLGHLDDAAYWNAVAAALGLAPDLIPDFARDYFSGDRLNAELMDLVRDLRRRGLRTAILSNDRPQLAEKIRGLGVGPLFDAIVISSHLGVMKPDRDAYDAVLAALDVAPGESVFVDDAPRNVEGARTVGMHAIHYRDNAGVRAALDRLLVEQGA